MKALLPFVLISTACAAADVASYPPETKDSGSEGQDTICSVSDAGALVVHAQCDAETQCEEHVAKIPLPQVELNTMVCLCLIHHCQ